MGSVSQNSPLPASEQPADVYARSQHLTTDYSTVDTYTQLSSLAVPDDLAAALDDEGDLRSFRVPSAHMNEQLDVTRAAMSLMCQVEAEKNHVTTSDLFPTLRLPRNGAVRLELPLLQTDPELDCIYLKKNIETRMVAHIPVNSVPEEPLDVSADESLEFPESAYTHRDEMTTAARNEKLEIDRNAFQLFAQIVGAPEADFNMDIYFSDSSPSYKRRKRIKLTPPLMTRALHEDFLPDPDICMVPLSSDPSTLLDSDLEAAHAALVDKESATSSSSFPELSPIGDTSLGSIKPTLASSLRIEEPLLPAVSHQISSPPAIDLGRLGTCPGPSQNISFDLESEDRERSDSLNDALKTSFLEDAAHATRSVEQEQLELRSTAVRMAAPIMDFDVPEPQWERTSANARDHLVLIMESGESFVLPLWLRYAGEESQLWWNPFPSKLGHVSLREGIDEDAVSPQLPDYRDSGNVPDSSAYVWKQPGLSILKEVWDDEELELDPLTQASKSRSNALKVLVDKRKSALEIGNPSDPPPSPVALIQHPGLPLGHGRQPLLSRVDDKLRSSALLSAFVDMRTSKRWRNEKSTQFQKTAPESDQIISIKSKTKPPRIHNQCKSRDSPQQIETLRPAPFPSIPADNIHRSIITSLSLSRGIQSWIEKLLPSINMIERDFNRWNTVTWNANSVSRSPTISPLAVEADIIVSSTTGIVITTLIQTIQKPLPGHSGRAAIRERIEKVACRYERLIVLVSEANRLDESMREISETESLAFSEFSGFVAGLETAPQLYYLGGGEETMSRWLAYFITKYSPGADRLGGVLMEEETTWELFLRRAGMNAFAAQNVVAMLKGPKGTPDADSGRYGLAGFINMTPAERMKEFSPLLGGERVIQRVGAVLDSSWS